MSRRGRCKAWSGYGWAVFENQILQNVFWKIRSVDLQKYNTLKTKNFLVVSVSVLGTMWKSIDRGYCHQMFEGGELKSCTFSSCSPLWSGWCGSGVRGNGIHKIIFTVFRSWLKLSRVVLVAAGSLPPPPFLRGCRRFGRGSDLLLN